MESSTILTITLVVMLIVVPVPSDQAHMKQGSVDSIRIHEPIPVPVMPEDDGVGDDRMDISRQGGGGGGWGNLPVPQMPPLPQGGGGWGQLPHIPLPGFGSMFGNRQLPFDAISGPYVSSSIGPAFTSIGPLGGIGVPFSPGPLGGLMGIPLAMIAMG